MDSYYYKVPSLSAAAILGHFDIVELILSSKKCNVDNGNSSVSYSLHCCALSILYVPGIMCFNLVYIIYRLEKRHCLSRRIMTKLKLLNCC